MHLLAMIFLKLSQSEQSFIWDELDYLKVCFHLMELNSTFNNSPQNRGTWWAAGGTWARRCPPPPQTSRPFSSLPSGAGRGPIKLSFEPESSLVRALWALQRLNLMTTAVKSLLFRVLFSFGSIGSLGNKSRRPGFDSWSVSSYDLNSAVQEHSFANNSA